LKVDSYGEQISLLKTNLETSTSQNEELLNKVNNQQKIINSIQKNDNKDNQDIGKFKKEISDFLKTLDGMQDIQGKNKELLQKTVQATLNLIKENKLVDKTLEAKIYKKVYAEFKKVFDSQRFRLNDLSIIENKLNEVLSTNNKMLSDLKRTKIANKNLIIQQSDLNKKLKKLEKKLDQNTSNVNSNYDSKSNNVINRLKNKKPNNAIVINKQANNLTIPKYEIQGIIDSRLAYIKATGNNNKARAYSVGDTLEGYGKILKMETSSIVTEKGTLRRERKKK
jgi:hypothetical protein